MNLNFTLTKVPHQKLKANVVLLLAGCLFAGMLSSCVKGSSSSSGPSATSIFAVVNASPNCPSSDFYLNNIQLNAIPFTYGNYLGYVNGPVGASKFGFYNTGTLNPIATDTLTLGANKAYTVFFNNLITTPTFVILRDTITHPATNSASIRLVDVSPDAPNVDLAIGNKLYISNISYKHASEFAAITPGGNDTLYIRQTGTTTVLAKVAAVTVQLGAVYTIWLQGFANPPSAGEGLSAGLMENAFFNQ